MCGMDLKYYNKLALTNLSASRFRSTNKLREIFYCHTAHSSFFPAKKGTPICIEQKGIRTVMVKPTLKVRASHHLQATGHLEIQKVGVSDSGVNAYSYDVPQPLLCR